MSWFGTVRGRPFPFVQPVTPPPVVNNPPGTNNSLQAAIFSELWLADERRNGAYHPTFTAGAQAVVPPGNNPNYLGVNLSGLNYYSSALAYLNVYKQCSNDGAGSSGAKTAFGPAAGWYTTTSAGTVKNWGDINADANGYPMSMVGLSGQQYTGFFCYSMVNINSNISPTAPNAGASYVFPPGYWYVSWTGKGTIGFSSLGTSAVDANSLTYVSGAAGTYTISGNQVTTTGTGTYVFTIHVTKPDNGGIVTTITQLPDQANYIRNLSLVNGAANWALYQSGEIVNPTYVSFLSNFGRLRNMDMGQTNNVCPAMQFGGPLTSAPVSFANGNANAAFTNNFMVMGLLTTAGKGSGYTPNTYNVTYTGGTGSGASGTVIVGSTGSVTSATVTTPGAGYSAGDQLTATLAGGGSGFAFPVMQGSVFSVGTPVSFDTTIGTGAGQIKANTVYFVKTSAAGGVTVSATQGGTAITPNAAGTATMYYGRLAAQMWSNLNTPAIQPWTGPSLSSLNVTFYNQQTVACTVTWNSAIIYFNSAVTAGVAFGNPNDAQAYYWANQGWANRSTVNDFCYSSLKGVPVEAFLQICNEAGCDAHFNFPSTADAAYISGVANLMCSGAGSTLPGFTGLNSANKGYIEYSNEIWNSTTFTTYHFLVLLGGAMFSSANGNVEQQYNGYMIATIGDAFAAVYGSQLASRIVIGMGTQFAAGNGSSFVKTAANVVVNGSKSVNRWGCIYFAPYFNGGGNPNNGIGLISSADQATVLAQPDVTAAILQLAYSNVVNGNTLTSCSALGYIGYTAYETELLISQINGFKLTATPLPFVGYESGNDYASYGHNAFVTALTNAYRDPRYQYLYFDPANQLGANQPGYLPLMISAGMQSINIYYDIAQASGSNFGILESIMQPLPPSATTSPKAAGCYNWIQAGSG